MKQKLYGHLPAISKTTQVGGTSVQNTAGEARTKSVTFSYRHLYMDAPVVDEKEHSYNRSLWTQDVK